MAMPDPYGLKEFKGPVLSSNPDPEEDMEALLMWEVPAEAYPSGIHQTQIIVIMIWCQGEPEANPRREARSMCF